MPLSEVAIRRAGALVALAAASALMLVLFPAAAATDRSHVVLMPALLAVFLLGCAAVLLSPAHRAVEKLARRTAGAARELRRAGFTGMVFYAVYVLGKVRKHPAAAAAAAAAAKEVSVAMDEVYGFLLFLVFLAALWTVYLSVREGQVVPGPGHSRRWNKSFDGGEVDSMCTCP